METYQIIAGFSDLKVLFRTKVQMTKSLEELELWFSFDGEVLWMHDYNEHEKCMALAILGQSDMQWSIYAKDGTYGRNLIEEILFSNPLHKVARKINQQFELYGFKLPFRG